MGADVPEVGGRPFAEAFDVVLSEYAGYTDDSLLDVTLDRLRQMVDVIGERRYREEREHRKWELQVAEIQARAIASVLPGLARNKKQANAIAKSVEAIKFHHLLDTEEEQQQEEKNREAEVDRLPSTEQVLGVFGVRRTGLAGVKSG